MMRSYTMVVILCFLLVSCVTKTDVVFQNNSDEYRPVQVEKVSVKTAIFISDENETKHKSRYLGSGITNAYSLPSGKAMNASLSKISPPYFFDSYTLIPPHDGGAAAGYRNGDFYVSRNWEKSKDHVY